MAAIRRICRSSDLNVDFTYKTTKRLLEKYRSAIWAKGSVMGKDGSLPQNRGKEEVRQWFLNLERLTMEDMMISSLDSMIFHICRTDWIMRLVDTVMERVSEFHLYGKLYRDILTLSYFGDGSKTDLEISEMVSLERSTYYRRKKEAVLLFGTLLWDEARMRKFA